MNYARLSIAGVIAAAGCASAHVNLYTLSSTPPCVAAMPRDTLAVQLPPARMPAQVNRREIVIRESGDRLALMENEQWASSPGDQISSAALVELNARLDKAEPTIRQQITSLALSIDVLQLEAVMDSEALLSATWSAEIRQGASVIKLSCPFSASRRIAMRASAVVVGYQQAVVALADEMALGVLNIYPSTHPPARAKVDSPRLQKS